GNAWQEGEVVEKQTARQVYEDFLHRKQDPALMEQGGGNEFSARVFPIPPNGTKEIIIAYSETLEAGAPYVLPLRGLPQLGALDIEVHASGAKASQSFGVHQQRFTPGADFVVDGKQLPRSSGLRSGELAIARVVPFASSRPEPLKSAIVLVDTSASRGLGLHDQTKLVKNVLAKLGDAQVVVACFDQEIQKIYDGKASGFGDKEAAAIEDRGALGASDFEQAIAWAADAAKNAKASRVVFVGDGVATEGETDAQKIKDKVQALRSAGVERMDAIATGGIRDDAFLRSMVRGVLDKDGVVLDGKLGAEALARRLGEATSSGVPVKVEGATWSWPDKLDGLQAGDEVMIYAQVDAAQPVRVTVGTQQIAPDLRAIDRPLVERAWAQAKIQSLIEAPNDDAAATKRQIIALSTRNRVMSPYTAMLVLETDWDYRRFGIDRNATVDILTVQNGQIAVARSTRDWEEQNARDNKNERKGAETAKAPTAQAAASASPAMPMPVDDAPAREGWTGNRAEGESVPPPPPNQPSAGDLGGNANGPIGQGAGGAPPAAHARGGHAPPSGGMADGRGMPAEDELRAQLGSDLDAPPATATAAPEAPRRVAPASPTARPARPRPTTPSFHDIPPATGNTQTTRSPGQVRAGTLVVENGIGDADVQRILRGDAMPRLRACYAQDASARGRLEVRVIIDALGMPKTVVATQSPDESIRSCAVQAFKSLRFPAPGNGDARFTTTFDFVPGGGSVDDSSIAQPSTVPRAAPYEGRFKIVMDDLSRGERDAAVAEAKRWQTDQPGDVMALVALGEAYEAKGDAKTAARAYGSILELFSFRADSRRFAGERLERLSDPSAIRLAIDTYAKAVEQRPDHPASHRLYAYTLLKHGEYEKAFDAIVKGASRSYPPNRFAGVDRILREDVGLISAAWIHAQPARRSEIEAKRLAAGGFEESSPSVRFVLVWETDANDVDFHIYDGKGGHAYYGSRELPSGGQLYADVTTGYGPECFTIRGAAASRAYPYVLQAHYYSRGPMGYGMGKLEILDHDGRGNITFEERPFVIQTDRAFVDLGRVDRPKPDATAMK
ncbi:MAG TPA: VIT domain-containing protein, partial [Labilithrix sp.]